MKLTKTKIYTLVALASVANYASADSYQNEVYIGISDGEIEAGGPSIDTESIDLSFVANFSEVDTSKGPLAEASFLDRASSFSLSFSDGEMGVIDTTNVTLALRLAGKENGLTGKILFSDREIGNVDAEALELAVGYYVAENTEIGLAYFDLEVGNQDGDSILLGVTHVSTGNVAFSIDAAVGTADTGNGDDTAVVVGGTVYPTSQLGIGASFSTIDSNVDNDRFSIFADWFVTPTAAITLSYSDSEIGVTEADSISLSTRFRF